ATCRRAALCRNRAVQAGLERGERWCWPVPAQLFYVVEQGDVGAERGQLAKKQGIVPLAHQRGGERGGVWCVFMPVAGILGDGLEVEKLPEHGSRRFGAPAGKPGIAVSRVAN